MVLCFLVYTNTLNLASIKLSEFSKRFTVLLDMSMKGGISMANPSSPPIPRSSNVPSSLVWTPPSSGIITPAPSSSTGFPPYFQKERHPPPESLRHPFQQHAYTIVDPQHHQQHHATPQSQGSAISQSMFNQMYNSQTRNAKIQFSQGLEFGGKHTISNI